MAPLFMTVLPAQVFAVTIHAAAGLRQMFALREHHSLCGHGASLEGEVMLRLKFTVAHHTPCRQEAGATPAVPAEDARKI